MQQQHQSYSAFEVARWLLEKAQQSEAGLTNLKLQKLLYYSQGRYLAATGRPLFREAIEAWEHGPVVSDVYHECKKSGSGSIRANLDDWPAAAIDREAARILEAVWAEEGGLAAWRLRTMTHNEPPWRDHFEDGGRHIVIPRAAILAFFRTQYLAPSLSIDDALSEWVEESHSLAEQFLPSIDTAEW